MDLRSLGLRITIPSLGIILQFCHYVHFGRVVVEVFDAFFLSLIQMDSSSKVAPLPPPPLSVDLLGIGLGFEC